MLSKSRYSLLFPIALLFFLLVPNAQGQVSPLRFQHLGLREGLSQSTSRTLFRDSRGFMWIGTGGGLNRFDGNRVKVYNTQPNDSSSLADPYVLGRMFEDNKGNLWFATATAVHCYQRATDNFRRFPLQASEPIQLDEQGVFWVCSAGILYQLDTRVALNQTSAAAFAKVGAVQGSRFSYMAENSEKGLFFDYGKLDGLTVYKWEAGRLKAPANYLNAGSMRCIVWYVWQERPDLIWCATSMGLCLLPLSGEAKPVFFESFNRQAVGETKYIEPLGGSVVAVAAKSGLYFFDTQKKVFTNHFYHQPEQWGSLAGDNIYALLLDAERNLWVSVWTKGIDYVNLNKNKFQFFQHKTQKSKKEQFVPGPMLQTPDGTVWCGSQMHGLIAMDTKGSLLSDCSAQVASPEQLFNLGRSDLLVRSLGGQLLHLCPATQAVRPISYQQRPLFAGAIVSAEKQVFYAAYNNKPGLFQLRFTPAGDPICIPLQNKALDSLYFYWGCRGRSSNEFFWVDYTNKVYQLLLQPKLALTYVTTLSSFPMASLSKGKVCWISGAFGLLRLSGDPIALRWITPKEGLPDNMVYALLKDSKEYLWLSTNKGLVRFQPDSLKFTSYHLQDGLQDLEFNRNSALATADGQFWFGGISGFNRFDPLAVRPLATKARLRVTGISIQDNPWNPADNISEQTHFEFSWDKSTLSFHFAGLEFSDPANIRLKYRMDCADGRAYDKDWVFCPDARGFARYANLPHGRYRLSLMAANSDGVWDESSAKQLNIYIKPPIWLTWWFLSLVAAAVIMGAYLFYKSRLARAQRANAQKLEMAEAEMKALRAQLTPHFINNSLNSLRAFLLRNDLTGANDYLSNFARLTRAILESSFHHTVRLEDELDLLRAYVKTETKHLSHPIHYQEQLVDDLDAYEIEVPGMLLQPFVENALVHGLKPLEREGHLTVRVEQQGQHLLLSVEDDGAGRKAVEATNTPDKPPSRALQITGDRLKYYDQRHGTRSDWRIVDLTDAEGAPVGTRAEIRLGLLKAI